MGRQPLFYIYIFLYVRQMLDMDIKKARNYCEH